MDEIQKELFDEFEGEGKGRRNLLRQTETRKISFSCSFETFLLGLLLLVMGMVVIYAVGVEVGRRENWVGREERSLEDRTSPVSFPKRRPVRKFTVQVASFKKMETAKQAMEQLKKGKGKMDVFLIPGARQIAVCVGTYAARADADRALGELRKQHKDSFVRNR